MRLLVLQFISPAPGQEMARFSHSLGVLAALAEADGIDCLLFPVNGFQKDLLDQVLDQDHPDCVLVDIEAHSVTAAHRSIGHLAERKALPVIVCGAYATCHPSQAISIPGVYALLLGEYEQSGLRLLQAIRDRRDPAGQPGVWVHGAGGLVRGPLDTLAENLDDLPFPNRDLFGYERLVDATGELGFKVARGCPRWCASCVNDWYMDLYGGKGTFVRRRSVANVLAEVYQVANRYSHATSTRFYDHCFADDFPWLAEFCHDYPRRCSLPYRCHVPIAAVTPEVAVLLAGSNCACVETAIGSGSRFIREEVLSMHISDDQIVRACKLLHDADLHVSAQVLVGCPYESDITIEESLDLLGRCDVRDVQSQVFYPTPGTRAAELCKENGWISGRSEDNYWLDRSVLDLPSLSPQRISLLATRLAEAARTAGRGPIRRLFRRLGGAGS